MLRPYPLLLLVVLLAPCLLIRAITIRQIFNRDGLPSELAPTARSIPVPAPHNPMPAPPPPPPPPPVPSGTTASPCPGLALAVIGNAQYGAYVSGEFIASFGFDPKADPCVVGAGTVFRCTNKAITAVQVRSTWHSNCVPPKNTTSEIAGKLVKYCCAA